VTGRLDPQTLSLPASLSGLLEPNRGRPSSRIMVFRFRPVSRSVERIEQPSRKQRIARSAASGLESIVSRVSFV
jgi:hypothetical protein